MNVLWVVSFSVFTKQGVSSRKDCVVFDTWETLIVWMAVVISAMYLWSLMVHCALVLHFKLVSVESNNAKFLPSSFIFCHSYWLIEHLGKCQSKYLESQRILGVSLFLFTIILDSWGRHEQRRLSLPCFYHGEFLRDILIMSRRKKKSNLM